MLIDYYINENKFSNHRNHHIYNKPIILPTMDHKTQTEMTALLKNKGIEHA